MFKALLIDFDGTLANTITLVVNTYKDILRDFGINLSEKEIVHTCMGHSEEDICQQYNIEDMSLFKEKYLSTVVFNTQKAVLFPHVRKALTFVKRKGIKMGIITYGKKIGVTKMLPRLNIDTYFDSVVTFDDVVHPKPDPEAVFLSGERLNVKSEECLVIGDTKNDIVMGKKAGSKTALFFPKEHEKIFDLADLKTTKPDYIFHNWSDIKSLIGV